MVQRLITFLLALSLVGSAAAITGCPAPDAVPDEPLTDDAAQEERTVTLYQARFTPREIVVEQGTTVIFENLDPEAHYINIPALDIDERLDPNETWSHTFEVEGEFAVSSREAERMLMDLTVK